MSGLDNRSGGIKYRPDIDGLRCVAVLSVFAFHLSPSHLPGGFVGVDVFFVISGYLISAIVFSEIASNRFSVSGFYERRVRRIFPALFGMLIGVSAIISFFLLPNEFIDYAKSVIAATLSSSNFYFSQHSGYFDSPTSKPMLHTWSLAVEEQFYIFFPIFLVITRRFFPRHLKSSVVILFFASLIASAIAVHYDTTLAFYMPYTRAWELLIGTIISLGLFPRLPMASIRNAIALLGIGMIVYACARYTAETPFPGLAALVPCVGSALLIGAGESGPTIVGKLLSWRPVVFVGLISYSLYLWHWPLIILNGLGLSVNLSSQVSHKWAFLLLSQTSMKLMEIVIAFVAATLSWRFIERPFRAHSRRIERLQLFAMSGAVMAALLVCSATVIYARGFEKRFPGRAVAVASFLTPPGSSNLGQLGKCEITAGNQSTIFRDTRCLQPVSGKANYLLLGDSHAGALWEGLKNSMPKANIRLAGVWGCRPSIHSDGIPLCRQMMDYIFQEYLPSHDIQGLFLEARWYQKNLDGIGEIVTWAKAHGVRVIIFGPVAEYDAPLPRLLAYSITWNKPSLASQHTVTYSPVMDEEMRSLAENTWHVCYASLYKATCESGRCLEYADENEKVPLLSDTDHLSQDGSRLIVSKLFQRGELDCLKDKSTYKTETAPPPAASAPMAMQHVNIEGAGD